MLHNILCCNPLDMPTRSMQSEHRLRTQMVPSRQNTAVPGFCIGAALLFDELPQCFDGSVADLCRVCGSLASSTQRSHCEPVLPEENIIWTTSDS